MDRGVGHVVRAVARRDCLDALRRNFEPAKGHHSPHAARTTRSNATGSSARTRTRPTQRPPVPRGSAVIHGPQHDRDAPATQPATPVVSPRTDALLGFSWVKSAAVGSRGLRGRDGKAGLDLDGGSKRPAPPESLSAPFRRAFVTGTGYSPGPSSQADLVGEQILTKRRRRPRHHCPICRKSLKLAIVRVTDVLTITIYRHSDGSACQRQR